MRPEDAALSLLSGLLGAVIGAVVTFQAQREAHNRDRKAAVRACMLELAQNVATIEKAIEGNATPPIAMPVWDAHGPLILSALDDKDAGVVGPAIYMFPVAEQYRAFLAQRGRLTSDDREYLENVVRAARNAGDILVRRLGSM
jgi:hypothetical protein